MKKFRIMITIFILLIIYIYTANITLIPNRIILLDGEKYSIRKFYGIETIETVSTSNSDTSSVNVELKLFGNIHLKDIQIDILKDAEVIPIGKIIGLKLYTNGVLIVGLSEIEDIDNTPKKPYEASGIQEGDTIVKINDKDIEDIETLKLVVNESKGEELDLTLLRDGAVVTSNIKPIKTKDNEYKLGLWVKDAATGVGTISYYEKDTQSFAALGHGIIDTDTDTMIEIDTGEIVTAKVLSIQKGEKGTPGEIRGTIVNGQEIGKVVKNTSFGIYGYLTNLTTLNIDISNSKKVALRNEIKVGKAKVICSLEDNISKEYEIEIEKIYVQNNIDNKSMQIRITDEELIKKTGGIIRGLSGAPIIQDDKFIGVITNVLVSNPLVGYAIFGDLMVKQMSY